MKLREFNHKHAERVFAMTAADAYELQRALKLDPNFTSAVGEVRSGPGGGVDATDFTVTFFMIAAMIDGTRRDIASRVWEYWHAVTVCSVLASYDTSELSLIACELTGRSLFGDAVSSILENPDYADKVIEIGVNRNLRRAWIKFRSDKGERVTHFARQETASDHIASADGTLSVSAVIGGNAVRRIAHDTISDASAS